MHVHEHINEGSVSIMNPFRFYNSGMGAHACLVCNYMHGRRHHSIKIVNGIFPVVWECVILTLTAGTSGVANACVAV